MKTWWKSDVDMADQMPRGGGGRLARRGAAADQVGAQGRGAAAAARMGTLGCRGDGHQSDADQTRWLPRPESCNRYAQDYTGGRLRTRRAVARGLA